MDFYLNTSKGRRAVTTPQGKVIVAVLTGAAVVLSLPVHFALRAKGRQGFFDERTGLYDVTRAGFGPALPPMSPTERILRSFR